MSKRKQSKGKRSECYDAQMHKALKQAAKLVADADTGDDTLARDICYLFAELARRYETANDSTELPDLLHDMFHSPKPPDSAAVYLLHLFDAGAEIDVRRELAKHGHKSQRKQNAIAELLGVEGIASIETGYTVADVDCPDGDNQLVDMAIIARDGCTGRTWARFGDRRSNGERWKASTHRPQWVELPSLPERE